MNRALPALALLLVSVSVPAQTGGEARSAFLERKRSEARAYHEGKRSERGAFLRRAWTSSEAFAPVEDPFRRGDHPPLPA